MELTNSQIETHNITKKSSKSLSQHGLQQSIPALSAAIRNNCQLAQVSADLLQIHRHMFWKIEDIIQCQLIHVCANPFPKRNILHVDDTDLVYVQTFTAFALFIMYCCYKLYVIFSWLYCSQPKVLVGRVYCVQYHQPEIKSIYLESTLKASIRKIQKIKK